MFDILGFFKKKKADAKEKNLKTKKFHINIPDSVLLAIGDSVSQNMPISEIKYMGRFLRKEHDIIVIGVCAIKDAQIFYGEESNIGISFSEDPAKFSSSKANIYNFSAKIFRCVFDMLLIASKSGALLL